MSAVEIALVVIAAAMPLLALGMGFSFWTMSKQNQRHVEGVLDRFLSRNMSEYGMTDMIKKEIEADQTQDDEETHEEEAFDAYIASRAADLGAGQVS